MSVSLRRVVTVGVRGSWLAAAVTGGSRGLSGCDMADAEGKDYGAG